MNVSGMLTGNNRKVYDGIKEALVRSSYYKEKMCDADGIILYGREKYLKFICRGVYDAMKKKKKRDQLARDVIRADDLKNRLKSRRNRVSFFL